MIKYTLPWYIACAVLYCQAATSLDGLKSQVSSLIDQKKQIPLSLFDNFMHELPLPQETKKLFNDLSFQYGSSLQIGSGQSDIGDSFSISGHIIFPHDSKHSLAMARLLVAQTSSTNRNFSFMVEVPNSWSFSSFLPALKVLDTFNFFGSEHDKDILSPRLCFSTFAYNDSLINNKIERGLNFISGVGLGGALEDINKFFYELKKHKQLSSAFSYKPNDMHFVGVITPEVLNSTFSVNIPMTYEINLARFNKKPLIDKISIGDLELEIKPLPSLEISIGAGAELTVPTQKDTIELRADVDFGASEAGIRLTMDGNYDPAFGLKGLGLSDLGFEIGVDFADLEETAILGIPITDLELRGDLMVGHKKCKTTIDFAGKFEFEAEKEEVNVDLIADVENVEFVDFIQILADLAHKNISIPDIPLFSLKEVSVYFVPVETQIVGKDYDAGLGVDAIAQFGSGTKFNLSFGISPEKLSLQGSGTIKDLTIAIGDVSFFDLKDINTQVYVSALDIAKSYFTAKAQFALPFLAVDETMDFSFGKANLSAIVDTKIGNMFDARLQIDLDFSDLERSEISFALKDDFQSYVQKEIATQLNNLQKQADQQIDDLTHKIKQAEKSLRAAKKGFNKDVAEQVKKTNDTIKEIKDKIDDLSKHCDKKHSNAKDCIDLAAQKVALVTQQDIYKKFLLKYGKDVVDGDVQVVQDVEKLAKDVSQWKSLRKTERQTVSAILDVIKIGAEVLTAFSIKKAAGSFTGKDVARLKSPQLSDLEISLAIGGKSTTITLHNIDIDFKDPAKFIETITKQIITEAQKLFS